LMAKLSYKLLRKNYFLQSITSFESMGCAEAKKQLFVKTAMYKAIIIYYYLKIIIISVTIFLQLIYFSGHSCGCQKN
jgi:hypothetical protein